MSLNLIYCVPASLLLLKLTRHLSKIALTLTDSCVVLSHYGVLAGLKVTMQTRLDPTHEDVSASTS